MAQVNLNMLALQAKDLMETEGKSEQEAIAQVIESAGISEEQAEEMGIAAEVSRMMNRNTEAEAAEAEEQLRQQASGFQSDILKDQSVTGENESTLQEETPDTQTDI
jgi:hypothetical protein